MTNEQIIKGFAICNDFEKGACRKCPYYRGADDNSCVDDMITDVYNLINRLKAEIERLNHIRAELSKENDELKAEIERMHEEELLQFEREREWSEYDERCE